MPSYFCKTEIKIQSDTPVMEKTRLWKKNYDDRFDFYQNKSTPFMEKIPVN